MVYLTQYQRGKATSWVRERIKFYSNEIQIVVTPSYASTVQQLSMPHSELEDRNYCYQWNNAMENINKNNFYEEFLLDSAEFSSKQATQWFYICWLYCASFLLTIFEFVYPTLLCSSGGTSWCWTRLDVMNRLHHHFAPSQNEELDSQVASHHHHLS